MGEIDTRIIEYTLCSTMIPDTQRVSAGLRWHKPTVPGMPRSNERHGRHLRRAPTFGVHTRRAQCGAASLKSLSVLRSVRSCRMHS